jgi:hypothetical protein
MRHKAESRRHFGAWAGIVLAAIVGVAAVSAPALAKPKPKPAGKPAGKRIAVLPPSEGTAKDAVITAKIVQVLKQHKIQAVSGAPVKKALGSGSIPSSDADWVALARTLKVDGVVESTISQTGAKRKAEVAVHNGADGSVAGREIFTAKGPPAKLAMVVAGGFWKKLGSAIKETASPKKDGGGAGMAAQGAPPSTTTPSAGKSEEAEAAAPSEPAEKAEAEEGEGKAAQKGEAKEPDEEEGEEAGQAPPVRNRLVKGKGGKAKQPRSVEVEVGGRVLRRVFQYSPSSVANAYSQNFLPVFAGHAAWFPITYAGIFASFEYNPALKTGTTPAYPVGTRELIIGAQGRYPLSFGLVGLSAAYFQHMFLIGDTSATNDPFRASLPWPDVAYQGVRVAGSGRFYLGDMVQVGVEAAYRLVTNPGDGGLRVRSTYYFPDGKTTVGLDGSAFVGVGVMPWLEIRAGVDYRRYVFGTLQHGPDNANSIDASGASDDYLGFTLGAVGVYGGR